MTEHTRTPGPWDLCPRFGGNENAVSIVGEDSIIATIWDRDAHGKEHPVSANARLIAAAPELLEALAEFLAGADAGHISIETDLKARAAIARAGGSSYSPAAPEE